MSVINENVTAMIDRSRAPAPEKAAPDDERVRRLSLWKILLDRPDLGSIAGTVLVFALFGIFAGDSGMFALDGIINWSQVAAYLGIIAVGACLLMIAGEFDLSMGSMIGFAGVMVAVPPMYLGWPVWASVLFAFAGSMALGALNGYLVVRTKLPSFIVTLAFMFILRGLTLVLSTHFANSTIVSGVGDKIGSDPVIAALFQGTTGHWVFSGLAGMGLIDKLPSGEPVVGGLPKVLVWWLLLAIGAGFVLARTRFGNWIFLVGGDSNAAKNVGVPVRRVKISLFVLTAFCACLFGVLQVSDVGSAAADRGLQKEFEAIIAVVIGGTLLTGGFGSVLGACFGAVIFGVVQIGISYTNIDSDWYRVFLGGMLLLAVLFNHYIRSRATANK
ncbi:monosaccharide ABC transporter membrane protein (CUT2 family) [Luteibacter rhizovicinus]|uniref:Xylose transport system permease protein XylH n=1 Tax=Luteibacter rhizovicinus TaxID=242606 RepID=A0A4R3YSD5_9GAMM|nr:ABC transporter permease [Luteibacter rhizovicinus]TCV95905.1 monosaccharide ABC transporter membrane protein (CUT2 family) [Luteibacter rhizovicinus]